MGYGRNKGSVLSAGNRQERDRPWFVIASPTDGMCVWGRGDTSVGHTEQSVGERAAIHMGEMCGGAWANRRSHKLKKHTCGQCTRAHVTAHSLFHLGSQFSPVKLYLRTGTTIFIKVEVPLLCHLPPAQRRISEIISDLADYPVIGIIIPNLLGSQRGSIPWHSLSWQRSVASWPDVQRWSVHKRRLRSCSDTAPGETCCAGWLCAPGHAAASASNTAKPHESTPAMLSFTLG